MVEGKPDVPRGPGGEPLFRYPLDYPVKAMGLAATDLAGPVRALVAAAVPGATPGEAVVRASSGGKYASVTVVVRLESEAQRQAIHAALQADPRVLYQL